MTPIFRRVLAGSRITANFPFGPRTGCAVNISLLSYCDELHLGINIDPAAMSDPPLFVAGIRDAFDDACACVV